MLKVEIHLKLSVPLDELDVNEVIALFQEAREQVVSALVADYLETIQDQILDETLGPKWADTEQMEAPWICPECWSGRHFKRRGSRSRVLRKTSLGRISFQLRQVTCCRCDSTFSPFTAWLGLEPYQVSTSEFQAKTAELVCQGSYARSARHIQTLNRVSISATALHRWVQTKGVEVILDSNQADDRPVILDSTRVRAGKNKRGCNLNLGMSVEGRGWTGGRPRLSMHPVCFGVGESWSQTGHPLTQHRPARLVYDGDENVTHWLENTFAEVPKQRCVWHLVRQLYRVLWEDGLNKSQARVWMNELDQILYLPEYSVQRSRAELSALTEQLRDQDLPHAATYLAAAEPYVFTYREQPDGMFFDEHRNELLAISTTSPVERQMREINRRTDVGARWSIPGVTNLISLDLVRRFDPDQWRSLWKLPQRPFSSLSVVKLPMRVDVELLSSNVKTT
jgi:hypothetical protein